MNQNHCCFCSEACVYLIDCFVKYWLIINHHYLVSNFRPINLKNFFQKPVNDLSHWSFDSIWLCGQDFLCLTTYSPCDNKSSWNGFCCFHESLYLLLFFLQPSSVYSSRSINLVCGSNSLSAPLVAVRQLPLESIIELLPLKIQTPYQAESVAKQHFTISGICQTRE